MFSYLSEKIYLYSICICRNDISLISKDVMFIFFIFLLIKMILDQMFIYGAFKANIVIDVLLLEFMVTISWWAYVHFNLFDVLFTKRPCQLT